VHEVEDLAQVAADPVQGVHHDRVTRPRTAQQLVQAHAFEAGAALLIGVDPLVRDATSVERVEPAVNGLLGGGDAGVAEVEPAKRVRPLGGMHRSVPETTAVRWLRNTCCGTNYGTGNLLPLAETRVEC
jgi:hypothetical protein